MAKNVDKTKLSIQRRYAELEAAEIGSMDYRILKGELRSLTEGRNRLTPDDLPDKKYGIYRRPLASAVGKGRKDLIEFLIECGADINKDKVAIFRDVSTWDEEKAVDMIRFLVEKGADIDLAIEDLSNSWYAKRGFGNDTLRLLRQAIGKPVEPEVTARETTTTVEPEVTTRDTHITVEPDVTTREKKITVEEDASNRKALLVKVQNLFERLLIATNEEYEDALTTYTKFLTEHNLTLEDYPEYEWMDRARPLEEAVFECRLDVVTTLLEKGATVEKEGRPPILTFIGNSSDPEAIAIQELLEKRGADRQAAEAKYDTYARPLRDSEFTFGNRVEMEKQVEPRAAERETTKVAQKPTVNQEQLLDDVEDLFYDLLQASKSEYNALKKKYIDFLSTHNLTVDDCPIDTLRPLEIAVTEARFDLVEFLVEHGAIVNKENRPLILTFVSGVNKTNAQAIITYLVERGADSQRAIEQLYNPETIQFIKETIANPEIEGDLADLYPFPPEEITDIHPEVGRKESEDEEAFKEEELLILEDCKSVEEIARKLSAPNIQQAIHSGHIKHILLGPENTTLFEVNDLYNENGFHKLARSSHNHVIQTIMDLAIEYQSARENNKGPYQKNEAGFSALKLAEKYNERILIIENCNSEEQIAEILSSPTTLAALESGEIQNIYLGQHNALLLEQTDAFGNNGFHRIARSSHGEALYTFAACLAYENAEEEGRGPYQKNTNGVSPYDLLSLYHNLASHSYEPISPEMQNVKELIMSGKSKDLSKAVAQLPESEINKPFPELDNNGQETGNKITLKDFFNQAVAEGKIEKDPKRKKRKIPKLLDKKNAHTYQALQEMMSQHWEFEEISAPIENKQSNEGKGDATIEEVGRTGKFTDMVTKGGNRSGGRGGVGGI